MSESVVAAPGSPPEQAGGAARPEVARGPAPAPRTTLATPMRRLAPVLAAVAGGCLTLAFPGTDWWPLAPVGVALLAVAARGASARRGAGLGLLTGLAFFLPHLHWSGIYVGALPWVALATLQASFVALLGALMPLVWQVRGGRAGTVVAVAGLWVGQEALRGRMPFGGFPWGRLAFSQADSPALGWAALGGAPLLSAVVAAAGGALAVAVVVLAERGVPRSRRAPAVAAAVAAALLLPALGLAVRTPTDAPRSAQIAAVQGNVPRAGLDFNAERRAVLDNHAAATIGLGARADAGRAPRPDVVLWPENASDIDPLRNPDAAAVIQRATDAVGVPVLVGAVLAEPADHLSNTGILWGPTGSAAAGPGARYVKRHPAPFGEYIPARSFFRRISDKVDLVRRDFVAGTEVGVLDAGAARLGDVICFEVAYDGLVRETVRQGADLLVVQTNNATFGLTDESVQQLAMSRVRAVENGRSVVHISTVGVSALVAPDGSLDARSGHFTQEILEARLPLRTDLTLASRAGVWPEVGLALLGLGLVAAAALRGRGRATTPPAREAG